MVTVAVNGRSGPGSGGRPGLGPGEGPGIGPGASSPRRRVCASVAIVTAGWRGPAAPGPVGAGTAPVVAPVVASRAPAVVRAPVFRSAASAPGSPGSGPGVAGAAGPGPGVVGVRVR